MFLSAFIWRQIGSGQISFYSLPIFFMCTLSPPIGVMEQIKKYLKHFFWRKYGMEDKGTSLIAWDKVCQPKDKGGLGVLDIATHNKCLLMKHLHKFLNQHDVPWVKLIWNLTTLTECSIPHPRDSFGGEVLLSRYLNSGILLFPKLVLVTLLCSGWIIGMVLFKKTDSLNFFPSACMNEFQSSSSLTLMT